MFSLDTTKPIIREFCAAGRLVNEWRDTIGYTLLVGLAIADAVQHKQINTQYITWATQREFFRLVCWGHSQEYKLFGKNSAPINKAVYTLSAGAVMCSLDVLSRMNEYIVKQSPLGVGAYVDLAFFVGSAVMAGGPNNILKRYQNLMWDYPRKKGDGGTTQTQKLMNGFENFAASFGNRVTQPVFVPVRRAVQKLQRVISPRQA